MIGKTMDFKSNNESSSMPNSKVYVPLVLDEQILSDVNV